MTCPHCLARASFEDMHAKSLNDRATVENEMWQHLGRKEQPSLETVKQWAIKLGVRKETK